MATDHPIHPAEKLAIIEALDEGASSGSERALDLVALLKVCLLPDHGTDGGLIEATRKKAWAMVHELSTVLREEFR